MKKIFNCLLTNLILVMLCWQPLTAQVQVQVMLQPPYPIHYDDYFFNSDQIVLQLINTTAQSHTVKLIPTLTGDNGVSATLKPSYVPSQPIALAAGQSLILNWRQLKAYNRNLSDQDVVLQGTSVRQLIRDEKLPEGNYTLCVAVMDYATGALLSTPGAGCAYFALTDYDPPVVIIPQHEADVPMVTPQFVNFSWTTTGIPGKTRYRIQLTDITQTGVFNPNDAFIAAPLQPLFDRTNLMVPVLNYGLPEPPLKANHKYAVRVQAFDPTHSISFKNDGWGPVSTFTWLPIGDPADNSIPGGSSFVPIDDLAWAPDDGGGGNPPSPDPSDDPGCFVAGAGTVQAPPAGTTHAPALNEEVIIGKFKMKVTQANGPNGKGEIFVAFLKTKIKVSYLNMQVNQDGFAVGQSVVYADLDQPGLLPDELLNQFNGDLDDAEIPYEDLKAFVNSQQRKVSKFTGEGGPAVGVPFSLNSPKNDLYFLGIEFSPTQAKANISLGLSFPEAISGAWVNLGLKGVIIRPNGFDLEEGKISLAQNRQIQFSDKATLVLKGNTTYMTFTCSGVDDVHIDGYVEISRSSALPVTAQGQPVGGDETLKANFSTIIESAANWVIGAEFSHPQFSIPGMQDILFSTAELIYDNSGTQNHPGMEFPDNHPKANPNIAKTWTGLYIGDVSLKLPDWMKNEDQQAIEISLQHLLLDKTGVWASAGAENILALGDGALGGWGFSIDSFGIVIESSVPAGGAMKGSIRVPVTETGLGYRAAISQGEPETNFLFSISTLDEVRIDMMIANATFAPNSSLTIEKVNGVMKPSAMLHGSLEIGWTENDPDGPSKNNLVSSFTLPTLRFQDMHIYTGNNNVPKLGDFTIELDNPNQTQGKLAGFKLNLSPPSVSNQDGEVSLKLGLMLTLTSGNSNGLSGGTDFSIIGKYDGSKKLFVYDRTKLNSIYLDIDIAVAKIEGEINLYEEDETYGNGFKGEIDATIKGIGIGIEVALQVGYVNNFDYFYFDAKLRYEAGFTIPGTVAAIYGFGGGFYYNMERGGIPQYSYNQFASQDNSYGEVGGSGTGVTYTPSNGTFGFSASVVFGLAGGPQSSAVFNGDVKFEMVLKKVNNGISISKMIIEGNGYAIAGMGESRDKASIKGTVKIQMDFIEPSFTLNTSLSVDVAGGIVKGSASINMHFSPDEWYVHLGRWDDKDQSAMDEPWTDEQRINLTVDLKIVEATFFAYFMMGSSMPELPPLPKVVRDRMMGQNEEPITDNRKAFPEADPFSQSGPGFAFGAGVAVFVDFKVLIFYVDIDFLLGFDVLLKNYGSNPDCESIGINGWYAKGQAYADIVVAAGLELDLWFWEGKFEMINFHGTAVLQASLPNPNWLKGQIRIDATALNGLIHIKTNVKFETGKQPECLQNASPFGEYPIVSEIKPEKGEEAEVYDDIFVAFNFPKGEFPVSNENDPEAPARYYYYKIDKFELKHGNNVIATQDIKYSDDTYSAKYVPMELLPPHATLKVTMRVSGYERHKAEKLADEKYEHTFKTKGLPGKIIAQTIEESRPQPKKRYFLQGTGNSEFATSYDGYIRFKNGKSQCYLFDNFNVDEKMFDIDKTEYLVQFKDLSNNKKYELPCTCDADGVEFLMPEQMKFSQIHQMTVIQRLTPLIKMNPQLEGGPDGLSMNMGGGGHYNPQGHLSGNGGGNGGGGNGDDDDQGGGGQSGQWLTGSYDKQITQGGYAINKKLLPHRTIKKIDVPLFKTFFRTSKHYDIHEKMQSYKVHGQTKYPSSVTLWPVVTKENGKYIKSSEIIRPVDVHVILLKGDENFDTYDTYGYTLGQGLNEKRIAPNITAYPANYGQTDHPSAYPSAIYADDMEYAMIVDAPLTFPEDRNYGTILLNKVETPGYLDLKDTDYFEELYEVYYNSKYGSIDGFLPPNTSFRKPHGPLTKAEIDEALASAPEEKEFNFLNLGFSIQPPSGNTGFQPISDLSSNVNAVLPIVDLTNYLVAADVKHTLDLLWDYFSPNSKDLYYAWVYQKLHNKYNRPKGTYPFYYGGKTFSYKIN